MSVIDRISFDDTRAMIAFCHAGDDKFDDNARRSTPIDLWRPLWAIPNTRWFSITKNDRRRELVDLPPNVTDVADDLVDLADTLKLCRTVDAVVTVDTAIANLAGTFRLPALAVLLGYVADWRWKTFDDGPDARSPWFPTATLFRQATPGDWAPVFAGVAAWIETQ